MTKVKLNYLHLLKCSVNKFTKKTWLLHIFLASTCFSIAQTATIKPTSDAFTQSGTYAATNFGGDTTLQIKNQGTGSYNRQTYLKFSLQNFNKINSAKLRIYGSNSEDSVSVNISVYGIENDSWLENTIIQNNAPIAVTAALGSVVIGRNKKYYEFDVTDFIKSQFGIDKVASLLLKDPTTRKKLVIFNSRENSAFQPELIIDTIQSPPPVVDQLFDTLSVVADSYTRNGTYANLNYGTESTLQVKSQTSGNYNRYSYLKFSIDKIKRANSAKLRIYGSNADDATAVPISVYGVDNDSWLENTITLNNAPPSSAIALSTTIIKQEKKYYEFDVTDFVKLHFNEDKLDDKFITLLVKDPANKAKYIVFNSKENSSFAPQLIVDTTPGSHSSGNALLFVENTDKFPSNSLLIFSKVLKPWSRDQVKYNSNHDSIVLRIHNKGLDSLIISELSLLNGTAFKIALFKGVPYSDALLPTSIAPGSTLDLSLKFIAVDSSSRVKFYSESLKIASNDPKTSLKFISLNGLLQRSGEGTNEPYAQEIINLFNFKTNTGFNRNDPDKGDTTKLKGDEILPSYFVVADPSKPVSVRQLSAYHGCCDQTETLRWFPEESASSLTTIISHIAADAQTMLPRRAAPNTPSAGTFSPTTPFGFKVGAQDWTVPRRNPGNKIGIRVWKAYDENRNLIPNTYIISNDYLGTEFTNFDYNDNTYYVTNLRPKNGSPFFSTLGAATSAVKFNERVLGSTTTQKIDLSNLGQTYSNGSKDPAITITSVEIKGDNRSEFAVATPVTTVLNAGETTQLSVTFNPTSQGLKTADLLLFHNNSSTPLRIPLYGTAKGNEVTVTTHYRIKSGSSKPVTVNGITWESDVNYAFDNLEPFTNSKIKQIEGTDEDALYLVEQSSNSDKKPFRYEMPLPNGDYWVRLHFAEIYWSAPGNGLTGEAGSRVMSIKMENELKLANLDVLNLVGSASALIKNIPVKVTDGELNIDFLATVNRPMVCAIEVVSFNSSSSATRTIMPITHATSNKVYGKLKIYPNPVRNEVKINFPASYLGRTVVQILDATGRIYPASIINLYGEQKTMNVDLSTLSLQKGVYFLKVSSENKKTETIKFIVK